VVLSWFTGLMERLECDAIGKEGCFTMALQASRITFAIFYLSKTLAE
jgi:hypothetical protein